ncbi:MAG: Sfum_1244 family protein [Acidiferrobacteraceae bacterium]
MPIESTTSSTACRRGPDLPGILSAVQKNCDISDALHAGDYTLCTYLLKMREYYRWEHDLSYFAQVPQDDLGAWLTAREHLWTELENSAMTLVPTASGPADPFDSDAINRDLMPYGYVYSAGYGRFNKPLFFLGSLLRQEEREGFTILCSSCEYARELAAPPAMLRGRTIFARRESARRFVWEKIDEWRWRKQDNAMQRALACYDFAENDAALDAMTDGALDLMILHELGEGLIDRSLGDRWRTMVAGLARSKAELVARAVRDHLADCRFTLPGLLDRDDPGLLHFYFANLDGLRRALFTDLEEAYRQWLESRDTSSLRLVAQQGEHHWCEIAHRLLDTYEADPARATHEIESLLPGTRNGH